MQGETLHALHQGELSSHIKHSNMRVPCLVTLYAMKIESKANYEKKHTGGSDGNTHQREYKMKHHPRLYKGHANTKIQYLLTFYAMQIDSAEQLHEETNTAYSERNNNKTTITITEGESPPSLLIRDM